MSNPQLDAVFEIQRQKFTELNKVADEEDRLSKVCYVLARTPFTEFNWRWKEQMFDRYESAKKRTHQAFDALAAVEADIVRLLTESGGQERTN